MGLLVVFAAASWMPVTAQEDLWRRVSSSARQSIQGNADEIAVTPSQRQSIARLLKSQQPPWTCDVDEPNGEWLNQLHYRSVPLSATRRIVHVEAGPGCARGGQGSNGAMWLIRFDGRVPKLLAGPQQGFDGFIYSIEPTTVKEYRDVIVGWHIGGRETGLGYFRFDGTGYRRIGVATLQSDEQGVPKIVQR
jgi:hypothetical protein